jgi:[ribosomal protein S5]-alanine N-acetyltransferase
MGNNKIIIDLVPFSQEFITNQYIGWLNNKELMKFSEQRHNDHTQKSCTDYYLSFENSDNLLYAILNNDKEHVGNVNAYVDPINQVADIGIIVGETRCGYGYLAWKEMMRILFSEKRIRKITAGAMEINKPMIKVFIKSGMKYEYKKRKNFIHNNQFIDLVGYSIFNSDILEN